MTIFFKVPQQQSNILYLVIWYQYLVSLSGVFKQPDE